MKTKAVAVSNKIHWVIVLGEPPEEEQASSCLLYLYQPTFHRIFCDSDVCTRETALRCAPPQHKSDFHGSGCKNLFGGSTSTRPTMQSNWLFYDFKNLPSPIIWRLCVRTLGVLFLFSFDPVQKPV
jgi:hypothetical protein